MILPTPANDTTPLFSFDEWRDRGYVILKGSKSVGRTASGLPGFSESQVKRGSMRHLRVDTIGQPSRTLQIDNEGNTYLEEPYNTQTSGIPAVNQYLSARGRPQYYVPPERIRPTVSEAYRVEQERRLLESAGGLLSREEAIRHVQNGVNIQNINPASEIDLGIGGVSNFGANSVRAERQATNAIVNTDIEDSPMMAYFNQMLLDDEYLNNKGQKKTKKVATPPQHEEHVLSNKRKIDI